MYKVSVSERIFKAVNFLIMITVFIVTVGPYLHVLAKALNDGQDTLMGGLTFYPRKFTLQHFKVLLNDVSMIRAAGLSVFRVVFGTFLAMVCQFSAAYVLTKKNLVGRKFLLMFFSITMFFGGGVIPTYIVFVHLGLVNNFWVYILPLLISHYHVVIMKSYIESSIPESLSEAAFLDGASEPLTLVKIILPLSKPVLATVALWTMVSHWNDWNTTLKYITQENLFTLQYKLMQLIKESERLQSLIQDSRTMADASADALAEIKSTPESLISAQVIVTTLPIIMVYPFIQKYFMTGITLGSVK